jgi:hypothetical protein
MKHFITGALLVAGVINLLPVIGVLGAERLQTLYAQPIENPNLLLLMRHRAVLLGLLGALLIAAAFKPEWRPVAIGAGLISMLAFVMLALPLSAYNGAIVRVFWADVVALMLLAAALLLGRRYG